MPAPDREPMIDEASIFCREAAPLIRDGHWERAAVALLARVKKLDMALQSLTPGGSEYVANPDLCVSRAKAVRDNYRQLWQDAIRGRKEL